MGWREILAKLLGGGGGDRPAQTGMNSPGSVIVSPRDNGMTGGDRLGAPNIPMQVGGSSVYTGGTGPGNVPMQIGGRPAPTTFQGPTANAGIVAPPPATGTTSTWMKLLTNPALWNIASVGLNAQADRSREDRRFNEEQEGDTLRRLQTAEYLAAGGDRGQSQYGLSAPVSSGEQAAAAALTEKLRARLKRRTEPGIWERVGGPASTGMKVLAELLK